MSTSMGMVQVLGSTYRIVRVTSGTYEAIRLTDDVRVGTFSSYPPMRLVAEACDERLLLEIAHAALRQAKTSWVGTLRALVVGVLAAFVLLPSSQARIRSATDDIHVPKMENVPSDESPKMKLDVGKKE